MITGKYYLLQQPEPLESLAIEKLAVWITSRAEQLVLPISRIRQQNETEAEETLSQYIEIMKNHLQSNVPGIFHDKLLNKTLEQFQILQKDEKTFLSRIIETLFSGNITSLSINFKQFMVIRDSFLSKAHLLSKVCHLNLDFDTSPIFRFKPTVNMDDVAIEVLEKLPHLKHLNSYIYTGTTKTLLCIAKNCMLIEDLRLAGINIRDEGINILTQLRNLKKIHLSYVSSKAVKTLLLSCPNLEEVVLPYKYLDLGEVTLALNSFAASEENASKTFNFKTYRTFDTFERLKTVFKMCPSIQHLIICARFRACVALNRTLKNNILAIVDLNNLRELTLEEFRYYHDNLKGALNIVGFNLTKLHILRTRGFDLNALMEISQTCPNLESFALEYCDFIDRTSSSIDKLDVLPFRNLKDITLDITRCFYMPKDAADPIQEDIRAIEMKLLTSQKLKIMYDPVYFLLSNCLNVEFITFTRCIQLPDDVMLSILDKNPLSNLKQLKIVQCNKMPPTLTKLSALIMDRLIQNCANHPEVIQMLSPFGLLSFH